MLALYFNCSTGFYLIFIQSIFFQVFAKNRKWMTGRRDGPHKSSSSPVCDGGKDQADSGIGASCRLPTATGNLRPAPHLAHPHKSSSSTVCDGGKDQADSGIGASCRSPTARNVRPPWINVQSFLCDTYTRNSSLCWCAIQLGGPELTITVSWFCVRLHDDCWARKFARIGWCCCLGCSKRSNFRLSKYSSLTMINEN